MHYGIIITYGKYLLWNVCTFLARNPGISFKAITFQATCVRLSFVIRFDETMPKKFYYVTSTNNDFDDLFNRSIFFNVTFACKYKDNIKKYIYIVKANEIKSINRLMRIYIYIEEYYLFYPLKKRI